MIFLKFLNTSHFTNKTRHEVGSDTCTLFCYILGSLHMQLCHHKNILEVYVLQLFSSCGFELHDPRSVSLYKSKNLCFLRDNRYLYPFESSLSFISLVKLILQLISRTLITVVQTVQRTRNFDNFNT